MRPISETDLALALQEAALAGIDAEVARLVRDRGQVVEVVMELRWRQRQERERMMRRIGTPTVGLVVLLLLIAAAAQAQTATPLHRWQWEQTGDLTGLSYELSLDGQPHAPVLGVACTGAGVCGGDLPIGIAVGPHTARMRAARVVDGVRLVSGDSNTLSFTYVAAPEAPGNLRIQPPQGVTVVGTIQQRYPFAGLDVASAWLDTGDMLYVGAQRLSVPGYTVTVGDRVELVLWRP